MFPLPAVIPVTIFRGSCGRLSRKNWRGPAGGARRRPRRMGGVRPGRQPKPARVWRGIMATPAHIGAVGATGNPLIDGLMTGGEWLSSPGGPVAHQLTYSLSLGPDGVPWSANPGAASAVSQAIQAWEAVANITITYSLADEDKPIEQSSADLAFALSGQLEADTGAIGITGFPLVEDQSGYSSYLNSTIGTNFNYPKP